MINFDATKIYISIQCYSLLNRIYYSINMI
nr:MAG TPA_asm: hypothetical protein [Caudoviricetes sp.]